MARSAGSHPKPLHPAAVRVLQERYGIELPRTDPTLVDDLAREPFDRVVTLCDRVREVGPRFPSATGAVHWSLPDPSTADDGDDAFHRTAAELEDRIDFLLAELARPGDTTTTGDRP